MCVGRIKGRGWLRGLVSRGYGGRGFGCVRGYSVWVFCFFVGCVVVIVRKGDFLKGVRSLLRGV